LAYGRLKALSEDVTDPRDVEQRLRQSEETLQQEAESADFFIWAVDTHGLYTYANSVVAKILGYTPDELIGKLHYYDLFPGSVRAELKTTASRIFEQKAPFEGLLTPNVRKDGRLVILDCTGVPVIDPTGRLAGYRGFDRITDQKRAEVVLRESWATIERQLQEIEAIYANAPVGLCVVDADLRCVRINNRMAGMNGLPAGALLGRTIREILPDLAPRIEPVCRQIMRSGEPVLDLEITGTTPAQPGIVRTWLGSYYPIKASDGRILAINGVVQEITERKRAEAALAESEERFRNLADSAPVIIWLNDAAGNVTFFNKQAIAFTGRAFGQLSPRDWLESIHPADGERVLSAHRAAMEAHSSGQMELRLRGIDGQYRWVLATAVARFTGGQFAGHIGTIIDITTLKHKQEQMLASQKLESLGVLAGGMAHDFNNLLGSILAESELMLQDVGPASPSRDALKRIREVTNRASKIVCELMAYAGQEAPETQTLDLNGMIADVVESLRGSISKQAILEIDLALGLPTVRANAAQIQQLLMNLITNAVEAIGDQVYGTIRLVTSREAVGPGSRGPGAEDLAEGDYVRLEIKDTGSGMAEEVRVRIFDPFFTTKFLGRGLGLAAVQGIVRPHGGGIYVSRSTWWP
jgi:PAS domain S-box-containing protein